MRHLVSALLFLVAAPALAQVAINDPWARATPPGAKVAAAYMVIINRASVPDRLVSASSPAAARVETHVMSRVGEVMKMREVAGFDLPPEGRFELKPGGPHLMFIDIKRQFKEGERIPVMLKFKRAGEVKVEFEVGRMGAMSGDGVKMPGHGMKGGK
jgi:copper(I)-binding protein